MAVDAAGGQDQPVPRHEHGGRADDQVGLYAVHDVGVAGFAQRHHPAVPDTDVGLDDAPVIQHHRTGDHQVGRGAAARRYLAGRYGDLHALEGARLDGLIVTGAEPVEDSLTNEPYWRALTRVIDWAEHNTASTIFSCLAAHAAVLHLDGIPRHRLTPKRFGLFECAKVSADGLLDGAPSRMRMPHSRWNDLVETDLRSHGYSIASRSMEAGIDIFTKQWASLFVFLQGHPEYDGDTLAREFRRDMRLYLEGRREDAPALPTEYFDAPTEDRMARFRHRAVQSRDVAVWNGFPTTWTVRPALLKAWKATSYQLFGNWLNIVAETSRRETSPGPA